MHISASVFFFFFFQSGLAVAVASKPMAPTGLFGLLHQLQSAAPSLGFQQVALLPAWAWPACLRSEEAKEMPGSWEVGPRAGRAAAVADANDDTPA